MQGNLLVFEMLCFICNAAYFRLSSMVIVKQFIFIQKQLSGNTQTRCSRRISGPREVCTQPPDKAAAVEGYLSISAISAADTASGGHPHFQEEILHHDRIGSRVSAPRCMLTLKKFPWSFSRPIWKPSAALSNTSRLQEIM